MNEFETLDNNLSNEEVSPNLKELSQNIGKWAKIIAIISIASQVISLIASFTGPSQSIAGSIFGTVIAVALYATLLNFGKSMEVFAESGAEKSFAEAMYRNRAYWQFLGIICIIALAFLLIAMAFIGDDMWYVIEILLGSY